MVNEQFSGKRNAAGGHYGQTLISSIKNHDTGNLFSIPIKHCSLILKHDYE